MTTGRTKKFVTWIGCHLSSLKKIEVGTTRIYERILGQSTMVVFVRSDLSVRTRRKAFKKRTPKITSWGLNKLFVESTLRPQKI